MESSFLIICSQSEQGSFKVIDDIKLHGIISIQGHLEFEYESFIEFIAFDGDVISKIIWNKISHSHTQNIFKINTRIPNNRITCMIVGDKYTINDENCPSFLIFTAFSEIFLGVLLEDSIKFWAVNSEVSCVESAVHFEEGYVFMNAQEKSGFYTVNFLC